MCDRIEGIEEEIKSFIEDNGRDLKFKIGDTVNKIIFDCTPAISYDYLNLDKSSAFSFFNPDINQIGSEEFPGLSDAQIYFFRINQICNNNFESLEEENFFITISPNHNLRTETDALFKSKLQAEQIPSFIEIRLYTNKSDKRAPRIFGFIGHAGIIYIMIYDPFHEIYNSTGKI